MNFKKYASYLPALFFLYGCDHNNAYKDEEARGYYTKNPYKIKQINPSSLAASISILHFDQITSFRKKLADRSPEWSVTGTEKKPEELWHNFYTQEIIPKVINKLEQANNHDVTFLKNYYDQFKALYKNPTEENERKLMNALKQLEGNSALLDAFKKCIAERYDKPEKIYLTQATLAYQEFFYFICNEPNKSNTLHIKLKKLQANLKKWQEDGQPKGGKLWKNIQEEQEKEKNLLRNSKIYQYRENQEAITKSLNLVDQLTIDPYSLSYKDLLETLPHGIKKLTDILHEVLENRENENIKVLKTYLKLVPDFS